MKDIRAWLLVATIIVFGLSVQPLLIPSLVAAFIMTRNQVRRQRVRAIRRREAIEARRARLFS